MVNQQISKAIIDETASVDYPNLQERSAPRPESSEKMSYHKIIIKEDLDFLEKFPKDCNGLYIVYELFTFDNLFRLLLKSGHSHEDALDFVLANCSISAVVFQERIHNSEYMRLSAKDALPAEEAACKAQLIHDLMEVGRRQN